MIRATLKNGWMDCGGVLARLEDISYFSQGICASLHFSSDDWSSFSCSYPEVLAVECCTPIEHFCYPSQADYEIERMPDGRIAIRIFAKEMPRSPVLKWIFPNPDEVPEGRNGIYRTFLGSVLTISENVDSWDGPVVVNRPALSIGKIDELFLAAHGDPCGDPPNVASWLWLILGHRTLSKFIDQEKGNYDSLFSVHLWIAHQTRQLKFDEWTVLLFASCARKVAEALSVITGKVWVPFNEDPGASFR